MPFPLQVGKLLDLFGCEDLQTLSISFQAVPHEVGLRFDKFFVDTGQFIRVDLSGHKHSLLLV